MDYSILSNLEPRMVDAIKGYVEDHHRVGGFLQAVISNNLMSAVMLADENNFANIKSIVRFFYNEAPSNCWKSAEAYQVWVSS